MKDFLIIVMIITIAVLWCSWLYGYNHRKKHPVKKEEPPKTTGLKVRISGSEAVKEPEIITHPSGQKTLDTIYAEKNGLWICRRCETMNRQGSKKCAACGNNR